MEVNKKSRYAVRSQYAVSSVGKSTGLADDRGVQQKKGKLRGTERENEG